MQTVFSPSSPTRITFILDPGHGGEDGGAVSLTGVAESELNLAVAKKMDCVFGLYGYNCLMLREDDRSLHSTGAVTLREKKISDLKNRVSQVNQVPCGALISIHQNSYPGKECWGLQTFFSKTDGSEQLAKVLQTAAAAFQEGNLRQSKLIPDNVYLMNRVRCPAVLVECGFLSNREEEARLCEDSYQRKLAAVLTAAAMDWAQTSN